MNNSLQIPNLEPNRVARRIQSRLLPALEQLKARLQARYEQCLPGKSGQIREVIRAAEEAAWSTSFPHLFLPELAHEGVSRLIAIQPPAFAEREEAIACLACAA